MEKYPNHWLFPDGGAQVNPRRILPLILIILLGSCSKDKPPYTPSPGPPFETKEASGSVVVPEGSGLDVAELSALSFAGASDLDETGAFTLNVVEATGPQVLFIRESASQDVAMLGILAPSREAPVVDVTSTALALTLFNPNLMGIPVERRQEYLDAVQANPEFDSLVQILGDAYQADGAGALDYELHPEVFETAVQVMRSTMESLGGSPRSEAPLQRSFDPPYIEDAPGNDIAFRNPRFIYYGAGVHPDDGPQSEVVLVHPRLQFVEFEWGWPPVFISEDRETLHSLGDGYYRIFVSKGGEFSEIFHLDTPMGLATTWNTGQIILAILELLPGVSLPITHMEDLSDYLALSEAAIEELEQMLAQDDDLGFLLAVIDLILGNRAGIATWIWGGLEAPEAEEFIEAGASILGAPVLVLQLLDFANSTGPFIADLAFATQSANYYLTLEAGEIVSEEPQGGLVLIPAGTFWMGAQDSELGAVDDEYPRHHVTLTHSFYIQSTEVTNQQYMDMAQWAVDHGYATATASSLRDNLDGSTAELLDLDDSNCEIDFAGGTFTCVNPGHPVKEVTWYGAAAYCDWLSLSKGLPGAYSHSTWQCNGNSPCTAAGYRLPTEAEWEYACRSGSTTAFANGEITDAMCNDPVLDQIGWYCGNAGGWTHPVAQLTSNDWDLYDMHGNLWEWCNDWYSSNYYDESPPDGDPVGPTSGSERVVRGGGWLQNAQRCRSAHRHHDFPDFSFDVGFRPARSAE